MRTNKSRKHKPLLDVSELNNIKYNDQPLAQFIGTLEGGLWLNEVDKLAVKIKTASRKLSSAKTINQVTISQEAYDLMNLVYQFEHLNGNEIEWDDLLTAVIKSFSYNTFVPMITAILYTEPDGQQKFNDDMEAFESELGID
ncbi:MAG: hypothetical protein RL065_820 [Bacteroidota bacterium]|jgi:hypothetical protein